MYIVYTWCVYDKNNKQIIANKMNYTSILFN